VLRALDLPPEASVLVPANSFVASALAVERARAQVRLVDCTEDSLIDSEACAARVDGQVKVVMPVHLFGQCAEVEKLEPLAKQHGLHLVEDAAQSQGAKRQGRGAGTFGVAAGTSFYPGKNLGAFGDAGAILTNDDAVAKRLRALRNYGSEVKYSHPEVGFNSRLDPLQAAILSVKLAHLAKWNAARVAAAARYSTMLASVGDVQLPRALPGNEHVWHIYAIRVPAKVRDQVLHSMHEAGIGVGLHYPTPIHLQGAFKHLGHRAGDFPVAERLATEMISLPMYPELSADQQAQVVTALFAALRAA
jgi:dTDP-4-amino-4,6-dideoxygalactose transaminase